MANALSMKSGKELSDNDSKLHGRVLCTYQSATTAMSQLNTMALAGYTGLAALVVGLISFAINWNVYGGGMTGYEILLFPGNLTLKYVWHPLFTDEINFWPKLVLHSLGQFSIVSLFAGLVVSLLRKLRLAHAS
ncbi:hypothetical protein AUP74_01497 [Microbulbifer aggregans]|uniref:Uncharacterized protein n=1 Tax=Microbulbifer aggregans TaxID=1769779 RepID=A0A1C9W701_9GAMM|nr:hypothetical protein AUP74_01497 [Microbulbifer aggregans]